MPPSPGAALSPNDPALSLVPHGARASYIYFAGRSTFAPPWASELGVYSATANGNVAPVRVIRGPETQMNIPQTAVMDSSGRLWTCSFNTKNLIAFAAGATGNVAPSVSIGGSYSPIQSCGDMTLATNGAIYATSFQTPSSIAAWAQGSTLNARPAAVWSGSNTGLGQASGLAIDLASHMYVSSAHPSEVEVFVLQYPGNVTPFRKLAGPKTFLDNPDAIAVDPVAQTIWVANAGNNLVEEFGPLAGGNVAPELHISGPLTQLQNPYGIAVDWAGYVYVGNCPQTGGTTAGSILVFAPGARGNVKPVQVIKGSNTQLACVMQMTVK